MITSAINTAPLSRRAAAQNNLCWYRAMMDCHGVPYVEECDHWACVGPGLPFYSNYCVKDPANGERHCARIAELLAASPEGRFSVADCFCSLDESAMHALGLQLLFEDRWYGASKLNQAEIGGPKSAIEFSPVQDGESLMLWEQAWQRWSATPGRRMFPQTLLSATMQSETKATFWSVGEYGGALTHDDGVTVGLSNVFDQGREGDGEFLLAAAINADATACGRPIVGYGSEHTLRTLERIGFVDLGPHRVWLRQ